MNDEQKLLINRFNLVVSWRVHIEDVWDSEQAVNSAMQYQYGNGLQYCKDHLSVVDSISQKDLNLICDMANDVFEKLDWKLRVINSMGEFIPATKKGD